MTDFACGHPRTKENTKVGNTPSRGRQDRCRICQQRRDREYQARKRFDDNLRKAIEEIGMGG